MPRVLLILLACLSGTALPSAAEQVNRMSLPPSELRLDESFRPDPYAVTVTSAGPLPLDIVGCRIGAISERPTLDLYYTTSGLSPLQIYARGVGDTTLLVRTPDGGWACGDDTGGGTDPIVAFRPARGGLYRIWLGSSTTPYGSATLYLSQRMSAGESLSGGTPLLHVAPTYGTVRVVEGSVRRPGSIAIRPGGSTEVQVGQCPSAYVAAAPDVDVYYQTSGASDLYLFVDALENTVLVVRRPDGSWACDDDGLGDRNPVVAIPKAAHGLYNVWVGTWPESLNEPTVATLYVSEQDPR